MLQYQIGSERYLSALSRHFTRYIVLITAIGMYILMLIFGIYRLSTPSDGTQLWLRTQNPMPDAVAVTPLIGQVDGLQANDRIIAVAGKPMTYWANLIFSPALIEPMWDFGDTVFYTVVRGGQMLDIPVKLGVHPFWHILRENAAVVIFLITLQLGSAWIFIRRPDERAAQTLFLAACAVITFSLCWFLGMDLAAFINLNKLWLYYRGVTLLMVTLMCSALLHFALLLPHLNTQQGIAVPLVRLIYGAPYVYYVVYLLAAYTPNRLDWLRRLELSWWLLFGVYFVLALVGILVRYRSLNDPFARRRVEAVTIAYIFSAFLIIILAWVPMWFTGQPWLGWHTLPLFSLPVMLGVGIAMIFYRLFDIKIIIQRTLIWGTLTSIVVIVYIVVVGILSVLFQVSDNVVFSLVATGIAAMVFLPLRERLQRGVNTLIYGERDTPYEVVMRLTRKLEAALAPQVALDMIVQTICEALKVSYAAIELCGEVGSTIAAEYGMRDHVSVQEWVEFPLNSGQEIVGRLLVAPRAPGDILTPGDKRLITGLTYQAEVTIQTVRLTAELQRSREKIVNAREEERRHLRRELHDGLGPTLASLTLQIDAARNFLQRDISQADGLLVELKSHIQTAVTDVRRLAYELRPPTLDELGLVNALREKAKQLEMSSNIAITVDAPLLRPMSAAIESAVYRIAVEALTNTARHAQATTCTVKLTLNGNLTLEVCDDGQGLPAVYQQGVGIHSMQERAAELGGICTVEEGPEGGTRVFVNLPVPIEQDKIKEG